MMNMLLVAEHVPNMLLLGTCNMCSNMFPTRCSCRTDLQSHDIVRELVLHRLDRRVFQSGRGFVQPEQRKIGGVPEQDRKARHCLREGM